ncbi:hypothetical protein [Galactobacillus timonensis]|uniref:hypothetical protein n=1 Tax=Galactobacillus timonensis TaxID=2041840 RepID=UPI0010842B1D|nr:hypothetical protein [Galactobacillus timonensis]
MTALPPSKVAVLVSGFRADSRTKKKISGVKNELPESLACAMIIDKLTNVCWLLSNNSGNDYPPRLVDWVLGREAEHVQQKGVKQFSSAEEFFEARYGGKKWQKE